MSIPDPMSVETTSQIPRRFHRFATEGSVRLYSGQAMWTTRLVDVSLAGVLVERPEQWDGTIGNRYRLDLRLDGGVMIGMAVELARIEPDAGLGFCRGKIDLASFAQLKRLVELNLGNYQVLREEIAALGD